MSKADSKKLSGELKALKKQVREAGDSRRCDRDELGRLKTEMKVARAAVDAAEEGAAAAAVADRELRAARREAREARDAVGGLQSARLKAEGDAVRCGDEVRSLPLPLTLSPSLSLPLSFSLPLPLSISLSLFAF